MSNAMRGVLFVKEDGTPVKYEPSQDGERTPTIVAEAFALGYGFDYVRGMMRLCTFEELESDADTLAAIENATPPPPRDISVRMRRRRAWPAELTLSQTAEAADAASKEPLAVQGETLPEPAWVVERVVAESGETEADVREFLSAAHHVVDRLVTDDILVIAYPLLVVRVGCPVWERFRYLVKGDWDGSLDIFDGTSEEVARELALPVGLVEQYPTAGYGAVLLQTADVLGFSSRGEERALDLVLTAWVETCQRPNHEVRSYKLQPAGRESRFEDWLVQELEVLGEHGYPVRLAERIRDGMVGRQVAVDGRRSIADLVCVVEQDTPEMHAGDLLVIENKATAVDSRAVDQLARYVDLLGASSPTATHGLLIADGLTVDAGRAISERGFGYLSLSSLGYRDFLRTAAEGREWDRDTTSVAYPGVSSLAEIQDVD
ncbi:endonuclease NucS domain-containing protein [Terrabacter terrae]